MTSVYDDPEYRDACSDEAWECATCRSKSGSPLLCDVCLHNRELVTRLKSQRRRPHRWREWPVKLIARLLRVRIEIDGYY